MTMAVLLTKHFQDFFKLVMSLLPRIIYNYRRYVVMNSKSLIGKTRWALISSQSIINKEKLVKNTLLNLNTKWFSHENIRDSATLRVGTA